MTRKLDDTIQIRINRDMYQVFKDQCQSMHRPHQYVVREMIEAFVDNRLSITPTDNQKKDHYHVD